ncbi:hypothetical protein SQ03_04855, partial [Methylobacterium platani JCM 14648]
DRVLCREEWEPARERGHEADPVVAARTHALRAGMASDPGWAHTLVGCHWGFILAVAGCSLAKSAWTRGRRDEGGRLVAVEG